GFGMGGERFGHEADLDQGADAGGFEGVEDLVGDGPVVWCGAVWVLVVGVGGAPFERAVTFAGGEEVVGSEVDGVGAEVVELAEEFATVGRGDVIGLVG